MLACNRRMIGEISCSGISIGEPLAIPDLLGEDLSGEPWQRTGVIDRGPAHPDDTPRGQLQAQLGNR